MTTHTIFRSSLVVLVAAVSALVLATESRPGPTASPDAGLVFARDGEIYVRGAGGAVRRLTRNRVFDGFPSWSPDRKRIVFVRSVAENDADVWIMNTDGTGARRLAGSARGAQDLYPAFSPDGRWIVFASDRGGREPDLYVMRADGKKLRRLVAGPKFVVDTQPRFSPDGRHVVFTSNRVSFFNHEIYRVRFSDGGGLQRLTYWGTGKDGAPGDDVSPSYSPDGKRIAFVSDRNGGYAIWTMDANGGDLREVSRHPGHNVVFPRFSPDGRSLVYTSFRDAQGRHPDVLWTVGADGSGRRSLGLGHAADW